MFADNQILKLTPIFSQRFRFADWPNPEISIAAAGVYAIWRGEALLYYDMSGRSIVAGTDLPNRKHGLVTRLHSHASGRLSGDQFCVYVANRLILSHLSRDELLDFGTGKHTLDAYTRRLIHNEMEYQFCIVAGGAEAMALEMDCRKGEIFGRKPLLNPS